MKNFYKILEVKENATKEEIREAFRRLSKKTHPDNNLSNPEIQDLFQSINEANQVLSHYNRRLEYDRVRKQNKFQRWQNIQKIVLILLLAAVTAYLYIDNNTTSSQSIPIVNSFPGVDVTRSESSRNSTLVSATIADSITNSETATNRIAPEDSPAKKDAANKTGGATSSGNKMKELSEKELGDIVKSIRKEVRKNGGLYNCIKVQKTISSNISNWISITPFLQKNGFVISGREIVAEDVEGWLLSAKGECVVLTVGKFEAD